MLNDKVNDLYEKLGSVKNDFLWGLGWGFFWDAFYKEQGGMSAANTVSDTVMMSLFWAGFSYMNGNPKERIAKKTGAFAAGSVAGQAAYHLIKYVF